MNIKHLFRWARVAVLAVAGALLFHSCLDFTPGNPGVVSLDTVSLYDELAITDLMAQELDKGEYILLGDVLIYDQDGHMVYAEEIETSVLDPLSFEVGALDDGEYTIVAIQSTCTKSRDVDWEIVGEEDLSTLRLMSIDEGAHSFAAAVGYAAATVSLYGGTFETSLSPKPMGSIVEIQIDHLTAESGYSMMTLTYRPEDFFDGFYLDPARSDDDRWIVIEEAYRYSRILCFAFPEEPVGRYFTLSHGDNVSLTLSGSQGEGGKRIAEGNYSLPVGGNYCYYLDLDRLHWQPPFFGTHEDFEIWKADRDSGILVFDPCLQWGSGIEDVENHVHAKQWWRSGNDELEQWGDNGWVKWYWVSFDQMIEDYLFENESGQNLIFVRCKCLDSAVTTEMAKTSLIKQGYVPSGKIQFPGEEPFDLFFSADGVTEVFIYPHDGMWEIHYQPTDPDDFQYIIED